MKTANPYITDKDIVDTATLRELQLFIDNDADLYRQIVTPMIANVSSRLKKGTYDDTLAPKLWGYLIEAGAKKYIKEFCHDTCKVSTVFSKATRAKLAEDYALYYKSEILLGNY